MGLRATGLNPPTQAHQPAKFCLCESPRRAAARPTPRTTHRARTYHVILCAVLWTSLAPISPAKMATNTRPGTPARSLVRFRCRARTLADTAPPTTCDMSWASSLGGFGCELLHLSILLTDPCSPRNPPLFAACVSKAQFVVPATSVCTVAILAQGTSRAVAVTQALLVSCVFASRVQFSAAKHSQREHKKNIHTQTQAHCEHKAPRGKSWQHPEVFPGGPPPQY